MARQEDEDRKDSKHGKGKDKDKDKDRDKGRHKDKERHRDRDKDKVKDKDRDRDSEHKAKDSKSRDEKHRDSRHKDSKQERDKQKEHKVRSPERDASEERPAKRQHVSNGRRARRAGSADSQLSEGEIRDAAPAHQPLTEKQQGSGEPEPALPPPPAVAPELTAPAAFETAAITPQVSEAGGEVSMSIEETNRVRIALGLKPLKMDGGADKKEKEYEAERTKRAEIAKQEKAEELRLKIEKTREKRLAQETLDKTEKLNAPAAEVDDLAAWVTRSRALEEAARAAERAKASRVASMYDEEDEVESDEELLGASAAELAGMRVKHTAEDIGEGETVILTLADKNILDDKGDLQDDDAEELENVLAAEEKQRLKARKAATKEGKPLWEEDGIKRGLLEKYDEEAPDDAMEISASGTVDDEKKRRQDDIRRKLAEAAQSAATQGQPANYSAAADFYTSEEMAQFAKPKKLRKKKKLRAKESSPIPDISADIAALEAAASVEAAAKGTSDHGSRRDAVGRREKAQADGEAAEKLRRQQRYDAALQKANYAALAAQQDGAEEVIGEEDEEAQTALEESLQRARRTAAKQAPGGVRDEAAVAQLVRRRQPTQEAAPAAGLSFTEASEFAISIGEAAKEAEAEVGAHLGEDDPVPAAAPTPLPLPPPRPPAAKPKRKPQSGGWVEADEEEAMDIDEKPSGSGQPEAPAAEKKPLSLQDRGVTGSASSALDRGELSDSSRIEWAGRTNDMKPVALMGLEDVYKGGLHADKLERDIEVALTRRDQWGRVMTPKEAFRDLSYRFHGTLPSKNKQEKKHKKVLEELAAKRQASSEQPHNSLSALRGVQQATATPYLVLSGSVRPAQTSDPASGYATVDRQSVSLTPVLGGGQTPLMGDRKVEAMLGLKKGRDSMPPPPPRKPK